MKNLIYIMVILLFGCSSVNVVKDKFDNSEIYKIEKDSRNFSLMDGKIDFYRFTLSKENKNGNISIPKILCKFKCYNNEVFEGNFIELNIDGKIYKNPVAESRLGMDQTTYHEFHQIGGFTYGSTQVRGLNYIVLESLINPEVRNAIIDSKLIMIRIYTKNIDGISKNTFKASDYTVSDIKDLLEYKK